MSGSKQIRRRRPRREALAFYNHIHGVSNAHMRREIERANQIQEYNLNELILLRANVLHVTDVVMYVDGL